MGHIHLGVLPNKKPWREVVALLEAGGGFEDIAGLAAKAAERSLLSASTDSVFIEAVRLLVSIPIAARTPDFADALRRLGLNIRSDPSFLDVMAEASRTLDKLARTQAVRTDFTELAGRAFSRALTDCAGGDLPGLLSPTAEDVRLSFQKFSRGSGMSVLCQSYFSTLVGSSLSYWLDRILAAHIGPGKRFSGVTDKAAFDQALNSHVSESTRIIQEFSAGWVGKTH